MFEKFDDRYHKQLFSHPKLVEELIRYFVEGDWTDNIDFSTLEKYPTTIVTEEYSQRKSDIINKALYKDDESIYFYILLEFQSTVDRFMALRVLNYVIMFYLDIVKQKSFSKNLPFILPIVLYNRDQKWNAAREINELIEVPSEELRKYSIYFKYNLISVSELDIDELLTINNALSTLFYVENLNIADVKEKEAQIIKLVYNISDDYLREDIIRWLLSYIGRKNIDKDTKLSNLSIQEVKTMLATSIKQREKELVQQGIEQGVQQGIQQGIQKGIKQGVQQGELKKTKSIIYKTLLKKFNIEMNAVSDIIESLNDIHKLDEILNVLIEQNNIDEVKKILDIK